ncbi:hypothetical protein Tco_1195514 [Tanacetum coccineum]
MLFFFLLSDYESWKIRIERYIRGKTLGKLIWRSIQNEPTPHPQITLTEGQGEDAVQVTRDKRDEEFTEIEKNKELADIQATNILSQGLPRHVFNILNQTHTRKESWDTCRATNERFGKVSPTTEGRTFPPTNNQLRTSSNSRSHATVHDGQIITETVQRRAPGNVGNIEGHVSRQCKEKKRVKDSQYFKDKMLLMEAKEKGTVLDVEAEAFLADVEYEGPHAAATFMANLSSTSGTNGATTSQVNEVHTDANQIFDNVNHLLTHEMHQEEHLDSGLLSQILMTIGIPYSMITILDDLRTQLDGHLKVNQEQSLVNDSLRAELARCKQEMDLEKGRSNPWNLKQAKLSQPTLYDGHALLNPTHTSVKVHDSEDSLVHAEDQRKIPCRYPSGSGEFKPVKAMFTEQIIPFYENVKQLVQKLNENIVTEVTEYMRIFDELDTEIHNDRFKVENENVKQRYKELSETIIRSRDELTGKITTLTAENAKLKTELISKISSGSIACKKPKVLAPGMYAISPKTENLHKFANLCQEPHRNIFVIRSLKSVNTKTPQAKHSVNHTKKVWKATRNHNVNTTKTAWRPTGKVVGSVKPQWKPTGRHFALYDNCPLTRIMEPIVEPLELTPSISSSPKLL